MREHLFSFLKSIGLQPLQLQDLIASTGQGSPYIGQVLSTAFKETQAVVVLLTGDDVARLRPEFTNKDDPDDEVRLTAQPRPNVLFEAGMALGINEDQTILVQVGKLRRFTDITGRHITYLDNTKNKREELISKLRTIGCAVELGKGTGWITAGDFLLEDLPESSPDDKYSDFIAARLKKSEARNTRLGPVLRRLSNLKSRVDSAITGDWSQAEAYHDEYCEILSKATVISPNDPELIKLQVNSGTFHSELLLKGTLTALRWLQNSIIRLESILSS